MASTPQLSETQIGELGRAARRSRSIRRAAAVARFNGWTLAVFAALSLAAGLWSRLELVLGAALAVLAWGEFAGGRRIRMLDLLAPRRLALNQVALCAVVVAYAGWKAYAGATTDHLDAQAADLDSVLGPGSAESIASLSRAVSLAVYGGVALASVVFQGLNAWYYASRAGALRAYLAATPAWVVQAERAVRTAS